MDAYPWRTVGGIVRKSPRYEEFGDGQRVFSPTPIAAPVRCSARVACVVPANRDASVLVHAMTGGGINSIAGSATRQVPQESSIGGAREAA